MECKMVNKQYYFRQSCCDWVHAFTDSQYSLIDRCGQGEFMDNVIKKVIAAREINHKGQGLWVSLKVLPGDLKQVSVICG